MYCFVLYVSLHLTQLLYTSLITGNSLLPMMFSNFSFKWKAPEYIYWGLLPVSTAREIKNAKHRFHKRPLEDPLLDTDTAFDLSIESQSYALNSI